MWHTCNVNCWLLPITKTIARNTTTFTQFNLLLKFALWVDQSTVWGTIDYALCILTTINRSFLGGCYILTTINMSFLDGCYILTTKNMSFLGRCYILTAINMSFLAVIYILTTINMSFLGLLYLNYNKYEFSWLLYSILTTINMSFAWLLYLC